MDCHGVVRGIWTRPPPESYLLETACGPSDNAIAEEKSLVTVNTAVGAVEGVRHQVVFGCRNYQGPRRRAFAIALASDACGIALELQDHSATSVRQFTFTSGFCCSTARRATCLKSIAVRWQRFCRGCHMCFVPPGNTASYQPPDVDFQVCSAEALRTAFLMQLS